MKYWRDVQYGEGELNRQEKMGTNFGDYIRKCRKEKGLGLRETARMVGVSASYLSRIESGDETNPPSEAVIRKLAEVLDEKFNYLMLQAERISKDIKQYVASTADLVDFLRTARKEGYGSKEFSDLIKDIEKKKKGQKGDGD